MLVDNAITSLLRFHSRVTIPNLGSIIKQADFSQAVFFNQFIRFDDGLLRTHLEKIESCTTDEVEAEITAFNNRVVDGVANSGFYEITNLGYFVKQNGRLELVNDKKAFAPPGGHSKEDKVTDIVNESGEDNYEKEYLTHQYFYTETHTESSYAEPTHNEQPAYSFDENIFKRKTSNDHNSWPLVLVGGGAIVLALLSALIYFGRREPEPVTTSLNVKDTTSQLSVFQTQADSLLKSHNPAVADSLTSSNVAHVETPSNNVYHIIIGSFKVEQNADRYKSSLNVSGVPALKLGKNNDFFLISFESYTDLSIARKKCIGIRDIYDGAWIIRWTTSDTTLH